jgi:polar amino acid transport system substrate-binding protein
MRLIALIVACCAVLSGAAAAQTLDRIAATRTVRVGFIADQAPFASKGDSGAPIGYATDVCARVVEEIGHRIGGIKPSYVETTVADALGTVCR